MAPIDLCSLERVRDELQAQDTDVTDDKVIPALITAYSRELLKIREFKPALTSDTRVVAVDQGAAVVNVEPWDLRSVSAVVIDDAYPQSRQVLVDGDWRLDGLDPQWQVYSGLRLASGAPYGAYWGTVEVSITGAWGFPSVPEDVETACVMAVTMHLRSEVHSFGSAFQPNSLADDVNQAVSLPAGIRGKLAAYRRDTYV